MSASAANDRYSPVTLVAWSVFIEAMRRKDFYVVLIMSALFALGVVIARMGGVMTPTTGIFLINLGMTLSFLFAAILTIAMAVRTIPAEMEQRTIHPLLAKPVSRTQVILGKWIAITMSSTIAMLVLLLIVIVPVPKSASLSALLFLQAIVLKVVALGFLAAMGMVFSLVMPRALNFVLLAVIYGVGGSIGNFLRAKAMRSGMKEFWLWIIGYIPNPDLMDLTKRYTDGAAALSGPQFAGIALYGIVATVFLLATACVLFRRKVL